MNNTEPTADRYLDHPWYEILRELIEIIYDEDEKITLENTERNLNYIENYLTDNLNENCPDYADIGVAAVNSYFQSIDRKELIKLINEVHIDDIEP